MHAERPNHNGFTLIELVIGMALLAVALAFIGSIFLPMFRHAPQPIYQVRAAELGQTVMEAILPRSFDENSDRTGLKINNRFVYCGAIAAVNETTETSSGDCSTQLGAEANEVWTQFDDVDDFNRYCQTSLNAVTFAALYGLQATLYENFSIQICVTQAPALMNAATSRIDVAKKIAITITTPAEEAIPFISYRSNY